MAACILSEATFSGIAAANDIIVGSAFYFTIRNCENRDKTNTHASFFLTVNGVIFLTAVRKMTVRKNKPPVE